MVVLVIVAVLLLGKGAPTPAPTEQPAPAAEGPAPEAVEPVLGEDQPSAIESQLEGINIEDLESEFQAIDQELQNL